MLALFSVYLALLLVRLPRIVRQSPCTHCERVRSPSAFSCLVPYYHCDDLLYRRAERCVLHREALWDRCSSLNGVRAPFAGCVQDAAESRCKRAMEGWALGRIDIVSVLVLVVFVRSLHPLVPLLLCVISSSVLLEVAERNAAHRTLVNSTLSAARQIAQPDYQTLHSGCCGLRRPLRWHPLLDLVMDSPTLHLICPFVWEEN